MLRLRLRVLLMVLAFRRSLVFASQVRVPFEAGEVLQSKTSANSYLFRIARVRMCQLQVCRPSHCVLTGNVPR